MSAWAISGGHPSIEEIAASIDGRLDDGERERLNVHLADCEDCYELFAETARFLRDEGWQAGIPDDTTADEADSRVLHPSFGRWRRSGWIAATLAAAAAGVAAVLVWSPARDFLRDAPPSVAELTAELPPADALSPFVAASWEDHGWGVARTAGPTTGPQEERAFQIGVRMVEMDVALAAGEAELAQRLADDLASLLEGVERADPLVILYGGSSGLRGPLEAGEPPATLLDLHRQGDAFLAPDAGRGGFVDATWYPLGKWAGAARLAAAVGDQTFFVDRSTRRELRRLGRQELPPGVARPLSRLEELTNQDPAEHMSDIVNQVDELLAVAGGGLPAYGAP